MEGSDSIFLIHKDNSLTELRAEAYGSEEDIQSYLEDYPELIPGTQMSDGEPLRWLLVRREQGVPGEIGGGHRWAVDHLFLDQHGVPTLVEVKRASDTRARREVVAQMLDYAANGVVYWPVERLRKEFVNACQARGDSPTELMAAHLQEEDDEENFWERVRANLGNGYVRLIFVADRIPVELLRIIEFLNEQMSPAIVLGLEIKQYAAQNTRTLVPRILGQTAATRTRKSGDDGHVLTPEEWWERFRSKHDAATVTTAERFAEEINEFGDVLHPSKSGASLALGIARPEGGYTYFAFIDQNNSSVWLGLAYLSNRQAFTSIESRQKILERLREVPGARIGNKALTGGPSVPFRSLEERYRSKLVAIVRDIAEELRNEPRDSSQQTYG